MRCDQLKITVLFCVKSGNTFSLNTFVLNYSTFMKPLCSFKLSAPVYHLAQLNILEGLNLQGAFNSCLAWNHWRLAFSNWKCRGSKRATAPELWHFVFISQLIFTWHDLTKLKFYEIWGFHCNSYFGLLCGDVVVQSVISNILHVCYCLHHKDSLHPEEHNISCPKWHRNAWNWFNLVITAQQ